MIELRGLQLSNPQGYLAGLGVLRIASQFGVPARLGWVQGVCCFEGAGLDELTDLLARFPSGRAGSPEYNLAKRMGQDAITMERYLELQADPTLSAWAEAMWYPGTISSRSKRGQLALLSSPLYLGGRQETWPTLRQAVELVSAEMIRATLTAEWSRVDNVSSLGWDPGGIKLGATLTGAKEPTAAAHQTEAASLWLAAEALPWLPARIQALAAAGDAWRYLVPTRCVDAVTAAHLLQVGHWIGGQELAIRGWESYESARVQHSKNAWALMYGARTTSDVKKQRGSRNASRRAATEDVASRGLPGRLLLV